MRKLLRGWGTERLLVPFAHFIAISGLALTLIVVVIIRSPYTHGNFSAQGYNRTDVAFVDKEYDFPGFPLADPEKADTGDLSRDGAILFFTNGCAACHGLKGQGGVVGPELKPNISASKIEEEAREGPEGMPAFGEARLPNDVIDKIHAFLRSRPEQPKPSPTATPKPTATAVPTATPSGGATASPTATSEPTTGGPPKLAAVAASPTVDGDASDWADIPGIDLELRQFEIPAGSDWRFNGEVEPKHAVLKVAADSENIYVLVEVDDSFDYVEGRRKLSPAVAVMFQIDPASGPHMGSGPDDFEASLGMVDIWHWELDCGPGVISGGGEAGSGNDPDCNFDDEYATDPESRDDDDQAGAENSLAGSWSHTGGSPGAEGTWIFEMSRPLVTGDSTDAQFAPGSTAELAIAYWDPKESPAGWSKEGHLTSADLGWIEVTLP